MSVANRSQWYLDKQRFREACLALSGTEYSRNGIGVLSEKTLHSVIKRFIEPNEAMHEVKVGDYYVGVKSQNRLFEIQTRSLNRLRPKLTAYLETEKVTVVYPDCGLSFNERQ